MQTSFRWMWRSVAALATGLVAASASAQIVVVVGAKSAAANLTPDQVSSLFLGKAASLPGGLSQPLDLPESNAARDQFYQKVAGKNASQVKAIWARLVFSGKGTPPKELASAAEVKKLLAGNAEAIGYIDKSAVDASVKTLLTLE